MEDTDSSKQSRLKYATLIDAFLVNEWPPEGCLPIGVQGRIFEEIVQQILDKNGIVNTVEERHLPKAISSHFYEAAMMAGRPLRTRRKYYLPDFTLADNIWIETTLWESEAHKKTFLYAHQCNHLIVLYLCSSEAVRFRSYFKNTIVISVYDHFLPEQIDQHIHCLRRLETIVGGSRCCSM